MASVFKPTGRRIFRIKFIDQYAAERTVSSDMTDRRAAEGLASLIERDVDRIRAGLQPERPDITGHYLGLVAIAPQHLPLEQIIDAYHADLSRQRLSEASLRHRRNVLLRLSRQGTWKTLHDITSNRITATLAALSAKGLAAQSTNEYRACLNTFMAWCMSQAYTDANPVQKVKPARTKGAHRPHARRSFRPEELRQLLDANPNSRDYYLVAALTGLRWSELSLVERRDFDLDKRLWTCRPEIDKCSTAYRLPLLPDLLPTLANICQGKKPTDRLFPIRQRQKTFNLNVARAGLTRIADDGRRLTFHSLRYTFCSLLAARLPLKTVQRLMRHANLKRTADLYLQLDLDSLIDQVVDLPPVFETENSPNPTTKA